MCSSLPIVVTPLLSFLHTKACRLAWALWVPSFLLPSSYLLIAVLLGSVPFCSPPSLGVSCALSVFCRWFPLCTASSFCSYILPCCLSAVTCFFCLPSWPGEDSLPPLWPEFSQALCLFSRFMPPIFLLWSGLLSSCSCCHRSNFPVLHILPTLPELLAFAIHIFHLFWPAASSRPPFPIYSQSSPLPLSLPVPSKSFPHILQPVWHFLLFILSFPALFLLAIKRTPWSRCILVHHLWLSRSSISILVVGPTNVTAIYCQ